MSWWGKVLGGAFGYMLGGPLGAVLGSALGHNFDKGATTGHRGGGDGGLQHNVQTAFFTATFSVMGHVAKADGRVSREEIQLAEEVMRQMALREDQRRIARNLFSHGKKPGFPLDEALAQFRKICRRHLNLFRIFIEIQVEAALADGHLHPGEERVLRHIAMTLGVSTVNFEQILNTARHRSTGAQSGAEPARDLAEDYKVLGVSEQAGDDEVKRAYRRLMNQYHPDKLVSKGLPEEMMNYATGMTRRVRASYENIRKARAQARESH